MGFDLNEPEQRRQLRAALMAADLTAGELWLNYFSIGGGVGEYEVEAYLQGLLSLPPIQRDLLAMAANELIEAVPRQYAPYSDDPDLAGSAPEPAQHPAQETAQKSGQDDDGDHGARGMRGSDEPTDPTGDD
ncbi:hypothetical protein [Arthrobacter sp. B10-11]|uniref:hypothetical protein n=1 Tax=Arthrobacter sp. B10-11 TaxID=3081160 RepID=UPI00295526EE|nr:hypothetical protein [Arthrobacter sp. B10-11]MDV8148925.1 hypothetical protein [Arthrobacter sp. B10-11]